MAPPVEPTTYIVAPNPEVLAQLIQENANNLPPAWAYVAPASPANTFTVQRYEGEEGEPFENPQVSIVVLKFNLYTIIMYCSNTMDCVH